MNTVSANLDVDAYLDLLTLNGSMVNVGMPEHPVSLSVGSVAMQRRSYSGR